MGKEIVGYTGIGPYKKGVTHVALWLESGLKYVFATYSGANKFSRTLPEEVALMSINKAEEIYRFKKWTLEEKVQRLRRRAREEKEWEAEMRGRAHEEYNRGWEETLKRAAARWDERHGDGNWAAGWR